MNSKNVALTWVSSFGSAAWKDTGPVMPCTTSLVWWAGRARFSPGGREARRGGGVLGVDRFGGVWGGGCCVVGSQGKLPAVGGVLRSLALGAGIAE